jgi:general secretion pathway protein C
MNPDAPLTLERTLPAHAWPATTRRAAWVRWGVTALVWLALGGSAAYWGWRWWGHAVPVTLPAPVHQPLNVDVATVAKALGDGRAAPASSTATSPVLAVRNRAVLVGVATDAQGRGVALVSVDGQAPVPMRVGASLPDGWVLKSLSRNEAVLTAPTGQVGEIRLSMSGDAAS